MKAALRRRFFVAPCSSRSMSRVTTSHAAIVRDAQPADVPAIAALEQAAPSAAHSSKSHYDRVFEHASPRRILLVAEGQTDRTPRSIAGFTLARAVEDEWEIENVVVSATWQRKGLGHLLLACLVERARRENASVLRLEVRASNAPAIALYRKCAFQQEGLRSNYYSNPLEDALLFSLSLRNSS